MIFKITAVTLLLVCLFCLTGCATTTASKTFNPQYYYFNEAGTEDLSYGERVEWYFGYLKAKEFSEELRNSYINMPR